MARSIVIYINSSMQPEQLLKSLHSIFKDDEILGIEEKKGKELKNKTAAINLEKEKNTHREKLLTYLLSALSLNTTAPEKIDYYYRDESISIYLNLKSEKKSVTIINTLFGPNAGTKIYTDYGLNNCYFPHLNV